MFDFLLNDAFTLNYLHLKKKKKTTQRMGIFLKKQIFTSEVRINEAAKVTRQHDRVREPIR